MTQAKSELLEAFRDDHALLGKMFRERSSALRGGNLQAAQKAAVKLDKEAGAHIAFEEQVFYPRLGDLLGEGDVACLLDEHRAGLEAVDRLVDWRQESQTWRAYAASAWSRHREYETDHDGRSITRSSRWFAGR